MTTLFIHSAEKVRGLLAVVTFGALAFSLTSVASAADSGEALQTIVKYTDLNVSNPAGAAVLYARIKQAARQVCYPLGGRDPASQARMKACLNHAITEAVAKVDEPALFEVAGAHHVRSTAIVLASASR
jgi:UrcA family protein